MKRIIGLTGTLTLHLAILVASFGGCQTQAPQRGSGEDRNITFLELKKEEVRQVTQEVLQTETLPTIDPIKPPEVMYCDGEAQTYEGVGVRYWARNGVVMEAPTGYPAYQAGIRVGDIILTPNPPNIDGYMEFSIQQGRDVVKMKIKVTTVCFNVQPDEQDEPDK